jgi:glycosyltransferase involved in cell wall biosynthesis
VIASSRFPVAEPFAGGLEAHTHSLVAELRRRGHEVDLFAAPGSDVALRARELRVLPFVSSRAARADLAAPPEWWMREHHAYLGLMLGLQRDVGRYDLIHNNSLHHLPIAMSAAVGLPVVTTLHTPPLPWLESAVSLADDQCRFIAVSAAMARQWGHCVDADVVHNGVDPLRWPAGPGGPQHPARPRAVWSGRLVPEKAPHLAVLAAREAGMDLDLVGPVGDHAYVEEVLTPLLGDGVRHLGHLTQPELSAVVGRASVAAVTPQWEEPFGLVAAEAMCSGTPVAAFDRGAMAELVTAETGRLARPGDVAGLAAAMTEAARLDRDQVRRTAVSSFGLTAMVDAYEQVYCRAVAEVGRAA